MRERDKAPYPLVMSNTAAASPAITPTSLKLFLAYAKDAGNWSGMPLVGGNVGGTPAQRGNLTQLKVAGLITTIEDRDLVNRRVQVNTWVKFTRAGVDLAMAHGVDIAADCDYLAEVAR